MYMVFSNVNLHQASGPPVLVWVIEFLKITIINFTVVWQKIFSRSFKKFLFFHKKTQDSLIFETMKLKFLTSSIGWKYCHQWPGKLDHCWQCQSALLILVMRYCRTRICKGHLLFQPPLPRRLILD